MDRREALSAVTLIFGGTIVGASNFMSGCQPSQRKPNFGLLKEQKIEILEQLSEHILPKTNASPGARDVGIGKFINSIVTDCYDPEEQKAFQEGIKNLREISKASYQKDFMDLAASDMQNMLLALEKEAKANDKNLNPKAAPHYYSMMKQLTVWGYLSSQIVGTKVMRHVPIPGRYEGCLPYNQGEKMYI